MNLIFALSKVFLASYRHNIFRSILVVAALLIAAAGLASVLLLNASAKDSYAKATQPLMQNVHFAIKAKSGSSLTKQDYATLRRQGHTNLIASTQKTIELDDKGKSQYVEIIGLDMIALLSRQHSQTNESALTNTAIDFDTLTETVLIHPDYAQELGINPLKSSTLQTMSGITLPEIKALDATGMGRQLVADINIVQSLFNGNSISQILVIADVASGDIKEIADSLPDHLILQPLTTGDDAAQLTDSFHLNLLAMGLLMFVVCMFVVMNALHLLLSKRIANLKVLRQLGVTRTQLIACQVTELVFLCIITALAGSMLGMEMASLVSPAVNQTLESLYGVRLGYGQVSLLGVLVTCILANILGGLIALIPAFIQINYRLSDISDNASVQTAATDFKPSRINQIALLLLVIVSTMTLFVVFANKSLGIAWDFATIALIIFSGCGLMLQLTPLILRKLVSFFDKIGPIAHWGISDAIRVSNKSKIAFCAFFIAVAANVGMNLMVDSFRSATDHWISSRLHADAYVSTNQTMKVQTFVAQRFTNVDLFIGQNELASLAEQKLQIRAYPAGEKHQDALLFYQAQTDVWRHFADNSGVLINQQYAFSKNLQLGDTINVQRTNGRYLSLPVSGIYLDYGNPYPQLLLPPSQFESSADGSENGDSQSRIISVFLPDDLPLSLFDTSMAKQFPNANVIAKQDLLSISMQTFEKTFAITNALNIATFLVAAFSLASSILVIDIDNRPQRGLMRSLGVNSRQLFSVSLLQYSGLSLLVCLLAVPFGILLSWILINLVNVKAFFWSYPLELDVINIVVLIATSLLIVLLMVIVPLIKYAYRMPMEDVKWLQG